MSTQQLTTKGWIDSAFSTAELVSFAIPEVGPILAAGEAVANFIIDLLFPDKSPTPITDPIQDAMHKAQADLSSALQSYLSEFEALTSYIGTEMKADITGGPLQKKSAYDHLEAATSPSANDAMPSMLRNMEDVMLDKDSTWREVEQILAVYVAGVGVDLLVHTNLIYLDALVGDVPNALQSGYINSLSSVATDKSKQINTLIYSLLSKILSEYNTQAPTATGMLTPYANDVVQMAQVITMNRGVRSMGGPIFMESPDYDDDYIKAIFRLAGLVPLTEKWSAQAQGWVDAQKANSG